MQKEDEIIKNNNEPTRTKKESNQTDFFTHPKINKLANMQKFRFDEPEFSKTYYICTAIFCEPRMRRYYFYMFRTSKEFHKAIYKILNYGGRKYYFLS